MNQAKGGVPPMDDIPEARREQTEPARRLLSGRRLWRRTGVRIGAIALLVASLLLLSLARRPAVLQPIEPISGIDRDSQPTASMPSPSSAAAESFTATQNVLLGHRAFAEAPAEDLVALTADGQVQLRRAAANKFQDMAAAAAAEGVILVPLSGFRSQDDQARLFFEVKANRGESASTRAEVSAPPGYSEHHTGYALDIGDGRRPETDVEVQFEQTDAYRWLRQNAAYYGFELSFDRDNDQGVAYEPWHWRFVGDRDSLETFYQRGAAAPQPLSPASRAAE
jgi:zinc D-Ala-D-Ala carboxypeptidase